MTDLFSPEEVAARRQRRDAWLAAGGPGIVLLPETAEAFHRHAEAMFKDKATRTLAIVKDYHAQYGKKAAEKLQEVAVHAQLRDESLVTTFERLYRLTPLELETYDEPGPPR